ncbi:MAG TPA: hypothetical protein VGC90_02880 [Candidatus Limnocylindrales bacterium]
MTAARHRMAALLVLPVALAACGASITTGTPGATPPSDARATLVAGTPATTATAAAPSAPRPSGPAVTIDATLLQHLPGTVDGLAVQRVPASDAIASSDAIVVGNADAAVTGLVIDAAGGEFAHATLVRLRTGVFGDAFFRRWRDAFDASVCDPAGGVAGHAEATIGGRLTFIDSCQAAVRTYHTWLPSSGVLVSVTSVGERRLGEQVVAALTD